jgi:uncharacterized protein (TIGR03435 family)
MIRTALAIFTVTVALAQTTAFEVASIRLHEGMIGRVGRSVSGTAFTVDAYTVLQLVTAAYNVKEYQVEGATGWMLWDRYDIAARSPGDIAPSTDQIGLMLQSLLAERFQLRLRWETRETPVYSLVVAKGGAKLRESGSDGPRVSSGRPGETMQIRFTGTPIMLAERLRPLPGVDRPVFDKTGLTGRYDFVLTLAPFTLRVPPDPAAAPVIGPSGESLFTAIEEQLGLKLESQKAPIEVLVIEHVERPSEN